MHLELQPPPIFPCMPRFLHPKHSTQHRVAVIALYRALLSRCTSPSLPEDTRIPLRNAIQNKFRKNRKVEGVRQLGLTFRAGYELLDHLDASAAGNPESVNILTNLVSKLPLGLTRNPPRPYSPPAPPAPRLELRCLPPEKALLKVRPYAKVSGPRHVPILASANNVPFLRITKPQPPALSRVIRQKLARRMKRFHLKVELEQYWLRIAEQEDQWDDIINQQLGERNDEFGWVNAINLAIRVNFQAYEEELAEDRATARKMQEIVDKETKLALAEGQTIIRGRRKKPLRVLTPDLE